MELGALDVNAIAREELPAVLARLVELEARVRLRLAEPTQQPESPSRNLNAEEAAVIAGTSRRWLLKATRGMKFRADLSRKQPRFVESGFRAWLVSRGRP